MSKVHGDVISSVVFYRDMELKRSQDDLENLSRVKRFLELLTGDRSFRHAMVKEPKKRQELADARGLNIEVRKLWRPKGTDRSDQECSRLSDIPLAVLWQDWIKDLITFRSMVREDGHCSKGPSAYNAWRRRQVERVSREVGASRSDGIVHAIMAFELSTGCSVGCWFCALGATRFKGHFKRTPANVKLWRDVLGTAVDLFGSAVQTSFCYWATEPFDNPNYLDFLQDYREVVGTLPQTTSAVPLRDLVWTRRLMEMHRTGPCFPSRFSITSGKTLKQVHDTFSPRELLRYELLMQQGDSTYSKARAGKTLRKKTPEGQYSIGRQVAPQPTTIACVSGFFINMMKKCIRLVSPCLADDRWPLGFRTHLSGSFSNSREFGDFIERSIATCMPLDLPPDRPLLFRECFNYEPREGGFMLQSDSAAATFTGSRYVRSLGELIAQGTHTPEDILGVLLGQGADLFEIRGTLKDLFEKGLLEDLPEGTGPGAE